MAGRRRAAVGVTDQAVLLALVDSDPEVASPLVQDLRHPVAQRVDRPGGLHGQGGAAHQDVGIGQGDVHVQGVVEPVEIVEQADDRGDLDDLRLAEMPAQLGEEVVRDLAAAVGHRVRQEQGRLLIGWEWMARGVLQPGDRLVADTELLCQSSV